MRKCALYILVFLAPFCTKAGLFGWPFFAAPNLPNTCFPQIYHSGLFMLLPAPNKPGLNVDFSAIHDGKKVLLSWKSGGKKGGDYFTIEKGKDGVHFSTLMIVKGSGHSKGELDYRDIDYSPYPGISYYRLKQTDYEGKVSYSPVMPVNFSYDKDGHLIASSGNVPDNEVIKKVEKKEVLVLVRDAAGNEFTAKVHVSKEQDEKLYATDNLHHLGKGSYIVVASSYNALYSQRLIVR